MSQATTPANPPPPVSSDEVDIEVNGVAMKAKKGAMIIQVTDPAGVYIPRFCYHEKLTVAANCRMCLVEVEKAPKPLPACATPVAPGMKIFTKSPRAIAAQKATMEFLLINHPLDCPICDQGGECELQDLALGFGRDLSRFTERKRVVKDKNIGPLISTDMTRCIHCTRCVRFGQEIAGIQELGTTGRGEWMEIGTFIERSVDHELSGNVIDLCPVGALNNKPFRFRARAWEMTQHPLVSPHDGVGSNLYGHVLRGRLMRIVPRPNEDINETWISDRDRYSYEGVYSEDRLKEPMVRVDGQWKTTDWESALQVACGAIKQAVERHGAAALGTLVAPSSTTEEAYLAARLTRALGSGNVDHRLRQQDFRDADADPVFPWLGVNLAGIEQLDSLLVIGSNLRREAPILAHRVRKAARKGAQVAFLNPARYEYLFPVKAFVTAESGAMVETLAGVVAAAARKEAGTLSANVQEIVQGARVADEHVALAEALANGERRAIILGALAMRHPAYADLRQLAAALAQLTGARLGYLPEGGNAVGAALAGALPHRQEGGKAAQSAGLDARAMIHSALRAYLLVGCIEPDRDLASEKAMSVLAGAECVVALTPFASESLLKVAQVLLPVGTFAETAGTFVNVEGRWQSFTGAAQPVGQSRPAWKVLRVLGTLLDLPGFDYVSTDDVRNELEKRIGAVRPDNALNARRALDGERPQGALRDVPMYQVDALVRRAPALQRTREAQQPAVVYK